MPDFWPLIKANLPTIACTLLFVGIIRLVAFMVHRWKSV